jgi:uncharacterized spore protein YtfJ
MSHSGITFDSITETLEKMKEVVPQVVELIPEAHGQSKD